MRKGLNGFWRYLVTYRYNSVLITNFLYSLLIMIVPILIVNYNLYSFYSSSVSDEIKSAHSRSVAQNVEIFDSILANVDNVKNLISVDRGIYNFLNSSDPKSYEYITETRKILDKFGSYRLIAGDIHSIRLYSEKNDYVVDLEAGSGSSDKFSEKYWLKLMDKQYENIDSVGYIEPKKDEARLLSITKNIDGENGFLGFMIITINLETAGIALGINNPDKKLFMYDSEKLIFSSGDFDTDCREYISTDTVIKNINGINYLISSAHSLYNGYDYVSIDPLNDFSGKIDALQYSAITTILIEVLLILLVSILISIRTYRPISQIIEFLNDGEAVNHKNKKSEVYYITKNIYNEKELSKAMQDELIRKTSMLYKAQAIALQSQINPHFLFNTLDNIKWKILSASGKDTEASEMVEDLSLLLRMSIATEQNLIPWSKEIEYCKIYINLLGKRYDGMFNVIWDIDENILETKTVALLLQPLVENAIYHGIKPVGEGNVWISVGQNGEDIVMTVRNDGNGMNSEELKRLKALLDSSEIKENSHIGLANVNQRMKIIFGKGYSINIKSPEGKGFCVEITFPKVV